MKVEITLINNLHKYMPNTAISNNVINTRPWNNLKYSKQYRTWLKRYDLGQRNSGARKYHYTQGNSYILAQMTRGEEAYQKAKAREVARVISLWGRVKLSLSNIFSKLFKK